MSLRKFVFALVVGVGIWAAAGAVVFGAAGNDGGCGQGQGQSTGCEPDNGGECGNGQHSGNPHCDGDPTTTPTVEPTASPTVEPTVEPTVQPTVVPTVTPTVTPEEDSVVSVDPCDGPRDVIPATCFPLEFALVSPPWTFNLDNDIVIDTTEVVEFEALLPGLPAATVVEEFDVSTIVSLPHAGDGSMADTHTLLEVAKGFGLVLIIFGSVGLFAIALRMYTFRD